MGDPRIGMALLLFHRERGNAWTEITHAQDPRRAEAVRRRHVQTQDRREPWGERDGRRGCIRRARRAGLDWPLPEGLTDETLELQLYPPAVAAKDGRPRPDWAAIHRELRRGTTAGIRSTDASLIEAARPFSASKFEIFRRVLLQSGAAFYRRRPQVRLGIGRVLVAGFIGELIGAREGLGYLISVRRPDFQRALDVRRRARAGGRRHAEGFEIAWFSGQRRTPAATGEQRRMS